MKRYIGIDPSTKTGIAIIDQDGNLIDALEITAEGKDPGRMAEIIFQTMENIEPGDFVAIEGFGFASQSGFLLGGIGWGIRLDLWERQIEYIDVAPSALKKFTGAGGNAGKESLAVEVYKRWEFQHKSNNVTDAYVLAQIVRALHEPLKITSFQEQVLNSIKFPQTKKKTRRQHGRTEISV
jgi:crossover junction endodeoxyribonuclease RuvC